ncbi:hypothetical protein JRI60_05750 [Archangium violaceum]|uniref:hypothetical protein n=1 Tax=Archangium violaceum TaxID=83451 RepID=UPI001950B39D|nr:hypothetical protein [Archangium violaceum]QRN98551.1 hypothetical protein JRI60_05750 [Archangium violaceum]
MSHAGNIKGRRGTVIGPAPTRSEGGSPGPSGKPARGIGNGPPREEKTQIGRMPTQAGPPRPGGFTEEKTQIGRMPPGAEPSRSGNVREEQPKTGIWNFAQDGLESGGEPRAGKARDDRAGRFEGPREGSRSTGERPRLRDRAQEGAEAGARSDSSNRAPPRTSERPQRQEAPRQDAPRQWDALATQVSIRAPRGMEVRGGEAKPLEDLLPELGESTGLESLAHHLSEEARYLGLDIRPSRLAPSERAERLWNFFLAYAEANARDPAGQTEAGFERFREVLIQNGFTGLRDANTGWDGVEVALQLLEARSPEELQAKLAEVRIEPGPEMLPSEVSTPVAEEHITLPEMPAVEVPVAEDQSSLKDDPFHSKPERSAQKQPVAEGPAEFDQAEPPPPAPFQVGARPPPGVVVPPGMVPPGVDDPDDVPNAGHDRRGTNKRLGSHMLWNVLHRFRDPPELSALEREKWSQVAFGAILALVGATLLVIMFASL